MSHHGVCPDWNRRAGHDPDGVTSAHGNWRLTDAGFAICASRDRKTVSGGDCGEVCNTYREPVHRTHVKRRAGAVGAYYFSEDSPR